MASKMEAVTFGIKLIRFSLTCEIRALVFLETQLLISNTRKHELFPAELELLIDFNDWPVVYDMIPINLTTLDPR